MVDFKTHTTVRISNAPKDSWYVGNVGDTFKVVRHFDNYVVEEDMRSGPAWRHIAKADCEVITSTPTQG